MIITSPRFHPKSRNSHVQPILEFSLNDHLPYITPVIKIYHGLWYDSTQRTAPNSTPKTTRIIPRMTNFVSFSFESISHEKDAKLETLQQQLRELKEAFTISHNDNKELRS